MGRRHAAIEDILIEKISSDHYTNIEDFLGYPISADVMENLEDRIREVLSQMPEDELLTLEQKYLHQTQSETTGERFYEVCVVVYKDKNKLTLGEKITICLKSNGKIDLGKDELKNIFTKQNIAELKDTDFSINWIKEISKSEALKNLLIHPFPFIQREERKKTRFFERKCHLISFEAFEKVMQELLDDATIKIEKEYPCLSCYSSNSDCGYDEDEIIDRIGHHLGKNIIRAFPVFDEEYIYFVEGE